VTALVAALWGLAEATLFFIVPDVFLSLVALRDRRAALVACGWAIPGHLSLSSSLLHLLYEFAQSKEIGNTA